MLDYKSAMFDRGISLTDLPPQGCTLQVGDKVEWTNDNGVKFEHTIIGFNYDGWYQSEYKKFVHLNSESFWFPHDHKTLTKIGA